MLKLNNYINHFALVIDESYSMLKHSAAVVRVVDGLTAHLAETSKDLNQETRLSVYAFNTRGTERCLVWDIDVLRMPSIAGMYKPDGRTALVDCTLLAINDLKTVPQKYGDHSFVIYVVTDGQENDSRNRYLLNTSYVTSLGDNWTLAVFVPDQRGVTDARTWGFPKDNITVWNPDSVSGVEDVGKAIKSASTTIMQGRKQGIRGSTSLFKLNTVTLDDIRKNLTPLTFSQYSVRNVIHDGRIDDFVKAVEGRPYKVGEAYYQLMKTETIQPQKQVAVMTVSGGVVYTGSNARKLLGLPESESVRVKPDNYPGYTIFVQSTSLNRKLISGTKLLILK